MHKNLLLISLIVISWQTIFAQDNPKKIVYIIDNIIIKDDPEKGDDILEADINDLTVSENKDSLRAIGYPDFDGAIYIFTKEFRKRSDALKQIPSSKQMELKNGIWCHLNKIYTGKFIDYYNSGRIQGEGTFVNGKVDGLRIIYYQNGSKKSEKLYKKAIPHGVSKEYYSNGALSQMGKFVNGKEDGVWEKYYPNGQVKQKSNFKNGSFVGESIRYYSNSKILSSATFENGKILNDKKIDKIYELLNKSTKSYEEGNIKSAIKYCDKVLEIDNEFADVYFSRGTLKLNDMQFDQAIADFDSALAIEPFMIAALANRAFARIRKQELGGDRKLFNNSQVTILASKTNKSEMSESDRNSVCKDLTESIFLGNDSEMVLQAQLKHCK